MTGRPSLTRALARFAVETDVASIPQDAVRAIKRAVLDSLGVTIAGARHPAAAIVVETIGELVPEGEATVVGHRRRADVLSATLANGVMAHVLDWDDALLPMRLRAGATLMPALLATGETRGWRAGEAIAAYAIGFEIEARLAAAISPSMPERGWHGTGVVGGIGVAAAVGRLLGLDEERLVHALGIAGTAGQGLVATFGSMSKALNLGRAAAAGVQSAHLAARGFTSHPDLLGDGGFLRMYDDSPRIESVTEDLGRRWSIVDNGYKPYPCGVVAHAAIDAVLDLRGKAPATDPLSALRLAVSPETIRLMGNADPSSGLEAKFSVRYAAAAAWVDGEVLPSTFDDARVREGRYRAAMAAVTVTADAGTRQEEAIADVETRGGWHGRTHVPHARGTRERPMSDDELRAKLRAACAFAGNPNGEAIIRAVDHLESTPPAELAALLVPSADVPGAG